MRGGAPRGQRRAARAGAHLHVRVAPALVLEIRARRLVAADGHDADLVACPLVEVRGAARRRGGEQGEGCARRGGCAAARKKGAAMCMCGARARVRSRVATHRTNDTCTPMRRCWPEQSKQMKTPYETDAHEGLRALQSMHDFRGGKEERV